MQIRRCKEMEKKITARDYKVLTEKISSDNVAEMAELIALYETKALIGFMGYHAERTNNSVGMYSAKTSLVITFPTVTSLSKAWRCSCAVITESIWMMSCIYPKRVSRER